MSWNSVRCQTSHPNLLTSKLDRVSLPLLRFLWNSEAGSYNQWSIKATKPGVGIPLLQTVASKMIQRPDAKADWIPKVNPFKTFLGRLFSGFWGNPLGHLFLWKSPGEKNNNDKTPDPLRWVIWKIFPPVKFALVTSFRRVWQYGISSRMHTLKTKIWFWFEGSLSLNIWYSLWLLTFHRAP